MKKFIMILAMLALVAGISFSDGNIGLNFKGSPTHETSIFLEGGYDAGYLGIYTQLGLSNLAGLVGFTVSTPEFPLGVFGGAGIRKADYVAKGTIETTYTYDYIGTYFDYERTVQTDVDIDYWTLNMFYEAGLQLDMGPVYMKMGWTNFDGNSVTMSFGASFN